MPGIGSLGGTELIIALVIILLLFGAKRIPELAKGLGSGVREFRRGTKGEGDDVEGEKKDEQITGEKEETANSSNSSQSETAEAAQTGNSDSSSQSGSSLQEDATAGADRTEQKKS